MSECMVISVVNCLDCPCSYRHPYDEELECRLSAEEPLDKGTCKVVDCADGLGIPHNCPLRTKPVLVTLSKELLQEKDTFERARQPLGMAVVNMPAVKKLELYSEYDVPTSELSEAEIYIARAHDVLRVEPDGCGFVPRMWLKQMRTFRKALNQPSLLRRIMPQDWKKDG